MFILKSIFRHIHSIIYSLYKNSMIYSLYNFINFLEKCQNILTKKRFKIIIYIKNSLTI